MAPNMASTVIPSTGDSLPTAKDLSAIFVPAMRAHKKSAFKSVMGDPTSAMINMAGGVPHPDTFPILQLQAKVKPLGSGNEGKRPRDTIVLNKSQRCQSTESLDELLQYGAGCGVESYCNFLQKYTQLVHRPKYSDWGVISSCGNTDAIGKAVSLFCEAGDSILVEKWTFPGALGSFAAAKVLPVPVDMDGEGMDPDSLDRICTSWGEAHPLRALYLVPTGQNPTGATMSFERRQKIYSVARKHNLAIIEDDPYYFLQLAPYSIGESSSINKVMMAELDVQQADALVPSLLSLDVDGRVIRLDSFSKVLAPNLRCGWITAPTYILDKLQILNESTILQPSGLTQGVISKLLNDTWGIDGWNRHLCELRAVYTYRRNMFVCMVDRYLSGLVEYVVPSAGMFLWMKINLGSEGSTNSSAMPQLLENMKKCGVMMAPGMPFCCDTSSNSATSPEHYLRAAFALVDVNMFEPALKRLAQAIIAIHGIQPSTVQDSTCAISKQHTKNGNVASSLSGKVVADSIIA